MEYRGARDRIFFQDYILCRLNFKVSGKLGLCGATLHLALRIIDLFMDGHDIQVMVQSTRSARLVYPSHIGTAVVLGLPWSATSGEQDGGKVGSLKQRL